MVISSAGATPPAAILTVGERSRACDLHITGRLAGHPASDGRMRHLIGSSGRDLGHFRPSSGGAMLRGEPIVGIDLWKEA